MKGGEGGDELEEGARAGGGETRSFWQPARGMLGRESVFSPRPTVPAGMNPLSDFFSSFLLFLFQNHNKKNQKKRKEKERKKK